MVARAPKRGVKTVGGVTLSHADRQLWPGITKLELAEYWQAVAEAALPGLAHRPLGIVRCPEGIGRERFFQKRTDGLFPPQVRDGAAAGSPYVALDDADGLIAMAQMSAIELHAWGAREADPLHPDWVVFDLDPGEGVEWAEVVRSAHAVRDRLGQLGLASFCRTTGGKGLHVVVPLTPSPDWDWERVKNFCRAFAELHGRGGAGALRRAREDRRPARPHPHRLAAQRDRQHGDRLVLSARPARRHGGDAARLGRGERRSSIPPASRCGRCRSGSRASSRIRGAISSMWISACRIWRRSVKRRASPRCRPRIQRRAPASSSPASRASDDAKTSDV